MDENSRQEFVQTFADFVEESERRMAKDLRDLDIILWLGGIGLIAIMVSLLAFGILR